MKKQQNNFQLKKKLFNKALIKKHKFMDLKMIQPKFKMNLMILKNYLRRFHIKSKIEFQPLCSIKNSKILFKNKNNLGFIMMILGKKYILKQLKRKWKLINNILNNVIKMYSLDLFAKNLNAPNI